MHYSLVKPYCSNFSVMQQWFQVSDFCMYFCSISPHLFYRWLCDSGESGIWKPGYRGPRADQSGITAKHYAFSISNIWIDIIWLRLYCMSKGFQANLRCTKCEITETEFTSTIWGRSAATVTAFHGSTTVRLAVIRPKTIVPTCRRLTLSVTLFFIHFFFYFQSLEKHILKWVTYLMIIKRLRDNFPYFSIKRTMWVLIRIGSTKQFKWVTTTYLMKNCMR